MVLDVPGGHPPPVHGNDLVVEAFEPPLMFPDDLRLELAVPVPGDIDLQIALVSQESFLAFSVSGIAAVPAGRVVLGIAEMLIHLGTHGFFYDFLTKQFEQSVLAGDLLGGQVLEINPFQ